MKPMLFAALLFALPACADDAARAGWVLISVDGIAVDYAATLDLDQPGRISGQGPCNRYFAQVEGNLPEFRPVALGSTKMACEALAAESGYFALLAAVETAEIGSDELHLRGGGHDLLFQKPTDQAAANR